MAEMTGRDYYIQNGYDELPEAVRIEMRRVFDTGVNNSGVWVRYKEVENLAGVMAYHYTHRPVATNADMLRSMSDEELAVELGFVAQDAFVYGRGEREGMLLFPFESYRSTLNWLKSPVDGVDGDD